MNKNIIGEGLFSVNSGLLKGMAGCFEKKGSSFHGNQKETKQGKWNVLDGESEGNFIFTRICDMGFAKKEAYDIVNKAEGCFFSPFLGGLIASPASKYLLD